MPPPPRKGFLLRLDPALHDTLQRWAGAELRSLNGQIEFVLRQALADAGRLPAALENTPPDDGPTGA
ncbi:MAG: hypothetical protein ACRENB_16105 [Gemmatimonadales bacterium]